MVVVELCQYRVSMLKMDERTLLKEAKEINLEKLQQAIKQVWILPGQGPPVESANAKQSYLLPPHLSLFVKMFLLSNCPDMCWNSQPSVPTPYPVQESGTEWLSLGNHYPGERHCSFNGATWICAYSDLHHIKRWYKSEQSRARPGCLRTGLRSDTKILSSKHNLQLRMAAKSWISWSLMRSNMVTSKNKVKTFWKFSRCFQNSQRSALETCYKVFFF